MTATKTPGRKPTKRNSTLVYTKACRRMGYGSNRIGIKHGITSRASAKRGLTPLAVLQMD